MNLTSPPADRPTSDPPRLPSRERVVAAGLITICLVLVARLVLLHVMNGPQFVKAANHQRVVRDKVPARPGDIVDRNGRMFATSIAVPSVFVIPSHIDDPAEISLQLGEALGLSPDELRAKIIHHSKKHFLWVKRRLTDDEADRVRRLKLPASVCGFRDEYRRHYPQGSLAAQVVGIRNIDNKGQGGVEEYLNAELSGQEGYRELEQDARGRIIAVHDVVEGAPRPGRNVALSIDTIVQLHAERALNSVMDQWKPQSACAVVLDPKTGEILAMASRPTFDPNHPELASPDAWKNRSIADIYEPGSTFKPFVVAWGVDRHFIGRDDHFNCENGEYHMGRRVLRDHHRYGDLSVVDILVKSSNIGMAKIGQKMGNAELYKAAVAFGFGGRTGIELPGELPGRLRPLKQWNSYSTGSIPMGQEISATPLQIISAFGVLANGGTLLTPRLVLREADQQIASVGEIASHVVSPQTVDWVRRDALSAVVSRGTGKKAAVKGYTVFGKTGTAQKFDPRTGQYSRELHVSSFVCGGPAEDPRALVIISVDQPTVSVAGEHFGGSVAAPAAGELLHQTLQHLHVPTNEKLLQQALLVDDFPDVFLE